MTERRKLNILPENPEKGEIGEGIGFGRFPKWLHRPLPKGNTLWKTKNLLQAHHLPTVCEEAKCPNLTHCWSQKTATFLAMGKTCTRACSFCDIDFSAKPKPLEADEPYRLAQTVQELGLKHVVITMVARDDLLDGGASHLVAIIKEVRKLNPTSTIEVLTSDFGGNLEALYQILEAQPEIFNHNIETVRSLTPKVRHKATYERTLEILRTAHSYAPHIYIKSGLMVGLGESEEEVKLTLTDLFLAGCKIITIGQYLQANRLKRRLEAFIHPDQFELYAAYGRSLGIPFVYSGPFVRSSFNAGAIFEQLKEVTHHV